MLLFVQAEEAAEVGKKQCSVEVEGIDGLFSTLLQLYAKMDQLSGQIY